MVKMVSMKRTKADREADGKADGRPAGAPSWRDPEDNGVRIPLAAHHVEKLGLNDPLPAGHKMTFHGTGTVAESHADEGGHRLVLMMDRAGVEHAPPMKANDRRGDIQAASDAAEAKKANTDSKGMKLGGTEKPETGYR